MVSLPPLILTSKRATNYKIGWIKTLYANRKRCPCVGLWQRCLMRTLLPIKRCLGCCSLSSALFFRAQTLPQNSFQRHRRHTSRLSPADERDGARCSRTGQEDRVRNPRRRLLMTTSGWQIEEGSKPGATGRGQLPVSRPAGGVQQRRIRWAQIRKTQGVNRYRGCGFCGQIRDECERILNILPTSMFSRPWIFSVQGLDRNFFTCYKQDVVCFYEPCVLSTTALSSLLILSAFQVSRWSHLVLEWFDQGKKKIIIIIVTSTKMEGWFWCSSKQLLHEAPTSAFLRSRWPHWVRAPQRDFEYSAILAFAAKVVSSLPTIQTFKNELFKELLFQYVTKGKSICQTGFTTFFIFLRTDKDCSWMCLFEIGLFIDLSFTF